MKRKPLQSWKIRRQIRLKKQYLIPYNIVYSKRKITHNVSCFISFVSCSAITFSGRDTVAMKHLMETILQFITNSCSVITDLLRS